MTHNAAAEADYIQAETRRLRPPGKLMDCATIAREYGMSRAAAEAVMRQLPKVQPDELRKTYCWRADVEAYFRDRTGR